MALALDIGTVFDNLSSDLLRPIGGFLITAVFVVLSDNLFNESSPYCIVPEKYRILGSLIDTDNDGVISDQEMKDAEAVLEKAKKQKEKKKQKEAFIMFHQYTNK